MIFVTWLNSGVVESAFVDSGPVLGVDKFHIIGRAFGVVLFYRQILNLIQPALQLQIGFVKSYLRKPFCSGK